MCGRSNPPELRGKFEEGGVVLWRGLMWYFEEGDVVLWRGCCGTLKRVMWYFEEGVIDPYDIEFAELPYQLSMS